MYQIYFRHGDKIGEFSLNSRTANPFLQVLVFSFIQSFNAVHFAPKKCSNAITCSLTFTSDVSNSVSRQRASNFWESIVTGK